MCPAPCSSNSSTITTSAHRNDHRRPLTISKSQLRDVLGPIGVNQGVECELASLSHSFSTSQSDKNRHCSTMHLLPNVSSARPLGAVGCVRVSTKDVAKGPSKQSGNETDDGRRDQVPINDTHDERPPSRLRLVASWGPSR